MKKILQYVVLALALAACAHNAYTPVQLDKTRGQKVKPVVR